MEGLDRWDVVKVYKFGGVPFALSRRALKHPINIAVFVKPQKGMAVAHMIQCPKANRRVFHDSWWKTWKVNEPGGHSSDRSFCCGARCIAGISVYAGFKEA